MSFQYSENLDDEASERYMQKINLLGKISTCYITLIFFTTNVNNNYIMSYNIILYTQYANSVY